MDNLHFDERTGQLSVLTENDSVVERVIQKLRFRIGEWFLDLRAGTPPLQGENVITSAIRSVEDVIDVKDPVFYIDSNRSAFYSATIETRYGTIVLGPIPVPGP